MSPRSGRPATGEVVQSRGEKLFNKNFILSNSDKKFLFSSLLCFMSIGGATLVGGAHKSPINSPGAKVLDLLDTGPVQRLVHILQKKVAPSGKRRFRV